MTHTESKSLRSLADFPHGLFCWLAAGCLLMATLVSCGVNHPDIPPELLQPTSVGNPTGGTEVGQVVMNLGFDGWRDPTGKTAGDAMERLWFWDFGNPNGNNGAKILLVNLSPAWCAPCRAEHAALPAYYRTNAVRGLRVLALIYENVDQTPATAATIAAWSQQFGTNFPLGMDPGHDGVNKLFGGADTPPFNLIIDARTMTIVDKLVGNDPFDALDVALAKP